MTLLWEGKNERKKKEKKKKRRKYERKERPLRLTIQCAARTRCDYAK